MLATGWKSSMEYLVSCMWVFMVCAVAQLSRL